MMTKMMVFQTNVAGTRAKMRSIGKFYTTFVVFKNGRMCDGLADKQLGN